LSFAHLSLTRAARKLRRFSAWAQHDPEQKYQDTVAAAAADDDAKEAPIYDTYSPQFINEGVEHPASVVESISLARAQPPNYAHYEHHIQPAVDNGTISNVQLETIVYASKRFEQRLPTTDGTLGARMGFFLGDGAGIGKVRGARARVTRCHHCCFFSVVRGRWSPRRPKLTTGLWLCADRRDGRSPDWFVNSTRAV